MVSTWSKPNRVYRHVSAPISMNVHSVWRLWAELGTKLMYHFLFTLNMGQLRCRKLCSLFQYLKIKALIPFLPYTHFHALKFPLRCLKKKCSVSLLPFFFFFFFHYLSKEVKRGNYCRSFSCFSALLSILRTCLTSGRSQTTPTVPCKWTEPAPV